MDFKNFKKKLLEDPSFKKEYEKRDITWEIAKMIIEARIFKGLTQEKLARLMRTKQPSIARIENGNTLPSLSFLERMALAMHAQLEIPKFNFENKNNKTIEIKIQSGTMDEKRYISMFNDRRLNIGVPVSISGDSIKNNC
jgi:transcriptional regulator with XRE-family HTH domain